MILRKFIGFSPIWLGVGYLLGCVFSYHVSVTLYYTDWWTIWPYVWMIAWPLCLLWRFILPFLMIALVIVVVVALIMSNSDSIRSSIINFRFRRRR